MVGTWAPKVCKIVAFMVIIMGLGLLLYILLGFRYALIKVELGLWRCRAGGWLVVFVPHFWGLGGDVGGSCPFSELSLLSSKA